MTDISANRLMVLAMLITLLASVAASGSSNWMPITTYVFVVSTAATEAGLTSRCAVGYDPARPRPPAASTSIDDEGTEATLPRGAMLNK